MATILMVDDDEDMLDQYARDLNGHTLLKAATAGEARDLFAEHQDVIDIITLDYFLALHDPEMTTSQLSEDFRNLGYDGPMVAASSQPEHNDGLVAHGGCDHKIPGTKDTLPAYVKELLAKRKR